MKDNKQEQAEKQEKKIDIKALKASQKQKEKALKTNQTIAKHESGN